MNHGFRKRKEEEGPSRYVYVAGCKLDYKVDFLIQYFQKFGELDFKDTCPIVRNNPKQVYLVDLAFRNDECQCSAFFT